MAEINKSGVNTVAVANLLWWQIIVTSIALGIFFVVNTASQEFILSIMAPLALIFFTKLDKAYPVAFLVVITAVMSTWAVASVLAGVIALAIFSALVVVVLVFCTVASVIEYAGKHGIVERQALIMVMLQLLVVVMPMIIYVLLHRYEIQATF